MRRTMIESHACVVITRITSSVNESTERITSKKKIKSSLHSLCNTPKSVTSLRVASPRHCAWATQLLSKKIRNIGEPLATLCWI